MLWTAEAEPGDPGTPAPRFHKRTLSTGSIEIDRGLPEGGLLTGVIHEFAFCPNGTGRNRTGARGKLQGPSREPREKDWLAPLTLLASLALSAVANNPQPERFVAWIGKRCWPTPHLLEQAARITGAKGRAWDWRSRCLFLDPVSAADRLWAIAQTARASSLAAVVADGSGFNFAATRRLQLAAKEGDALCLLARPSRELGKASAANTRWRVMPAALKPKSICWTLELLRAHGLIEPLRWNLEWTGRSRNAESPWLRVLEAPPAQGSAPASAVLPLKKSAAA